MVHPYLLHSFALDYTVSYKWHCMSVSDGLRWRPVWGPKHDQIKGCNLGYLLMFFNRDMFWGDTRKKINAISSTVLEIFRLINILYTIYSTVKIWTLPFLLIFRKLFELEHWNLVWRCPRGGLSCTRRAAGRAPAGPPVGPLLRAVFRLKILFF